MLNVIGKVWGLLNSRERRKAIVLFLLMLVGMVLETISIGLIIPVLGFLSNNNYVTQYPFLSDLLFNQLKLNHESLILWAMFLLLSVYIVKNTFIALLAWFQIRFIFGVKARLSQTLFNLYLHQPYTFHLQRNSAQLIRNTFTEIGTVVGAGLQPGLFLLTEGLVVLGITILLLNVEPVGIIVMISLLSMAGWLFYRLTRKKLLKWGEAKQYHEGMRIQHLQQGLGGVKDIKVLGREAEFLDEYRRHNYGSTDVLQKQSMLQQIPRLFIEVLAIFGLTILALIMQGKGKSAIEILPVLGVFMAAAIRLMPSANRILNAVQQLKFGLPVINTLHKELNLFSNSETRSKAGESFNFEHKISLDNIVFTYPGSADPVLKNISLSFEKGRSVGFVGGSGAGKSTLVDIILGLIKPDQGEIYIDTVNVNKSLREWQDLIGYVPQDIYLTDDTLKRNIAFGLPNEAIDDEAVNNAIRMSQLESFIYELPAGCDTLVGERGIRLSGGQRQRIGIARALYHNPPVLVLDEATSSLDIKTEKDVMQSIKALRGDKTIVIIAHRLSTVEHCDLLVKLENGRIIKTGTYKEVIGATIEGLRLEH